MSGGATTFKPTVTKQPPISYLNRGSTADDQPVIVSSTKVNTDATVKSDKGNGMEAQQPIGTRGEQFSPSRPRVYFTTDVGPDIISPGGHYMKVDNVMGPDLDATLKVLYDDVSCQSPEWCIVFILTWLHSSSGL